MVHVEIRMLGKWERVGGGWLLPVRLSSGYGVHYRRTAVLLCESVPCDS